MLIVSRIFTGIATFIVAFIVLYIGSLMIGGMIAGATASNGKATDFQSGYEIGREAGAKFGRAYGGILFIASFAVACICAVGLPLSGLCPWCTPSRIPAVPSGKKFRIAVGGQDMGDRDVTQIKKMLLTGELTLSDYYLDPVRNEWLPLSGNSDLSQ